MIIDDEGNLFVCGYQNAPFGSDGRIYKIKKTPTGYDANHILIASGLGAAWDIVMDQNKNLFCLEPGSNGKIYKISYIGGGNYNSVPVLIASGFGASSMGLAINRSNGNLYTLQYINPAKILEFTNSGGVYNSVPTQVASSTTIFSFSDIVMDSAENLYVTSEFFDAVYCLPKVNGVYSNVFSTIASGLDNPTGIAIDQCDNLFTCNQASFTLSKIVRTGSTYNPSPVLISSGIIYPQTIAVDKEGNLFTNNTTIANIYFVEKDNPEVSITTPSLQVCANSNVVFTASVSNTGVESFQYQWKKNGMVVGTNSPAYSDNTINNNDIISCELVGISSCFVESSDSLQMVITPSQPLSISITASVNAVCKGGAVLFHATGSAPNSTTSFQWKKNGINVGTNSNTYSATNLNNGDVIHCAITSTSSCLSTPTATSNNIVVTVLPDPVVSLDKSASLCTGDSRQLDAGSFNSYLWNDGSIQRTLLINNIGIYYVTVTDNNGCKGSDTTTITTLLASPASFLPADTSMCAYESLELVSLNSYNNYLWNTNSRTPAINITSPGLYWLEVADNNNCKGRDSIRVDPKQCMKGFYVPSGFTPNNDGKNDKLRPLLFGNVKEYKFTIYDRWGQVIFQSTEVGKGWDGTFRGKKQDSNVFVWTCTFQLEDEKIRSEKGTVMLIR